MRWIGIVVGALVAMAPSVAGAEEEGEVIREADRVIYQKKTQVDFNEGQVDGELLNPDTDLLRSGRRVQFNSMIQPRRDFLQELERSVDD